MGEGAGVAQGTEQGKWFLKRKWTSLEEVMVLMATEVVGWDLSIGWGKECIPNIYVQRVRPADRRVGYGGFVMDPGTYREPGIVEARYQKGRDRRLFSEKESRGVT